MKEYLKKSLFKPNLVHSEQGWTLLIMMTIIITLHQLQLDALSHFLPSPFNSAARVNLSPSDITVCQLLLLLTYFLQQTKAVSGLFLWLKTLPAISPQESTLYNLDPLGSRTPHQISGVGIKHRERGSVSREICILNYNELFPGQFSRHSKWWRLFICLSKWDAKFATK